MAIVPPRSRAGGRMLADLQLNETEPISVQRDTVAQGGAQWPQQVRITTPPRSY